VSLARFVAELCVMSSLMELKVCFMCAITWCCLHLGW